MSTPEGFPKIIKAAKAVGIYKDMVKNWFFLLDEFQAFVTESFRQNILLPFDHFWEFNNKSVISATPFYFSDPRFNQLNHYKIRFNAPIGTIKLVDCRNPQVYISEKLTR